MSIAYRVEGGVMLGSFLWLLPEDHDGVNVDRMIDHLNDAYAKKDERRENRAKAVAVRSVELLLPNATDEQRAWLNDVADRLERRAFP